MKYGKWSLGQVEALVNRIGEEASRKLLDCSDVAVTFSADNKSARISAKVRPFKVWRTIHVGNGLKSQEDFSEAARSTSENGRISFPAQDLFSSRQFVVAEEEGELDLVVVSVEDLGLHGPARYDEICVRASKFGLDLCPAEVGPQLRIQYLEQWRGEFLVIAMGVLESRSSNELSIFSVECGKNHFLTLAKENGNPHERWASYEKFVFVLPRK